MPQFKLIATLLLSFLAIDLIAEEVTVNDLNQQLKQQAAEIELLKSQLLIQQNVLKETRIIAETSAEAYESALAVNPEASKNSLLSIGGYGEHHYNSIENSTDQIDAHRYVVYLGYEFDENVKFFSEVELEHSLAGDGKPGEVELEQAFIDWNIAEDRHLIMGLFLVPVGILNETHEPDTFYGVERNQVESRIIPSTWWETGVMLQGDLNPNVSYNLAVHSGLETAALNSDGDQRNLRIRSGRQKSAEANADDLAYTARITYRGIQGLQLAATLNYQTDITQSSLQNSASALLLSTNAIYQKNQFSVRSLYAHWSIDNDFFEAANSDSLSGWMIEPSWRFNDRVGVFARLSDYERADSSVPILNPAEGLPSAHQLFNVGVNYWLTDTVVIKADFEDVQEGSRNNSFNLGLGWSF